MYEIRTISAQEFPHYLEGLAELLIDAVNGGAVLGLSPPLGLARARRIWQQTRRFLDPESHLLLAVFTEDGRIAGSAQLVRSDEDDGRHRADVKKVLVHRSHRRRGLGRRLMIALEDAARDLEINLMILDTEAGGIAERLYHGRGWIRLGEIPGFARDSDGTEHAAAYYYKRLNDKILRR